MKQLFHETLIQCGVTTKNCNMAQKIIIDTDPGQDDAVALLLALASPENVDVLGVVAVAGNVGLAQNAQNALKIVELSGRVDVPVFAGSSAPLQRRPVTAEHVHGDTGLNGADLPAPQIKLQEQDGVDFIIGTILANAANSVTLCALGPLTNIAVALTRQPKIANRIQKIVLMGGAYFQVGNITPAAEFNIYVDPEAADIVFRSGVPIVVASLDVTHKVLTSKRRLLRIANIGNACSDAVVKMLKFSAQFDLKKYGWDGAPLHDPCVIAYLIKPELFVGRMINVSIETQSELTRGMSVADFWSVMDQADYPANAKFLSDVDANGLYDLLCARLARLP